MTQFANYNPAAGVILQGVAQRSSAIEGIARLEEARRQREAQMMIAAMERAEQARGRGEEIGLREREGAEERGLRERLATTEMLDKRTQFYDSLGQEAELRKELAGLETSSALQRQQLGEGEAFRRQQAGDTAAFERTRFSETEETTRRAAEQALKLKDEAEARRQAAEQAELDRRSREKIAEGENKSRADILREKNRPPLPDTGGANYTPSQHAAIQAMDPNNPEYIEGVRYDILDILGREPKTTTAGSFVESAPLRKAHEQAKLLKDNEAAAIINDLMRQQQFSNIPKYKPTETIKSTYPIPGVPEWLQGLPGFIDIAPALGNIAGLLPEALTGLRQEDRVSTGARDEAIKRLLEHYRRNPVR